MTYLEIAIEKGANNGPLDVYFRIKRDDGEYIDDGWRVNGNELPDCEDSQELFELAAIAAARVAANRDRNES